MKFPPILQGGMGIAVSGWALASAVARTGQIGTVSGAGLSFILARRLQAGDAGGHYRRALSHFPVPAIAARILDRYFIDGGKDHKSRYVATPMPSAQPDGFINELTMAACFAEVWLAKEGHTGLISINLLSKVQVQTLASLYGAMLANVDIVSMGAGIPLHIPGILDSLAKGQDVQLSLDVIEGPRMGHRTMSFSPARMAGDAFTHAQASVRRPAFLPIISSVTLASILQRRANGKIDGFVIESPIAGGHNAPPRGGRAANMDGADSNEVTWGERDEVDTAAIAQFGLPFYLAGGMASHQALCQAQAAGAIGVQIGSAFAYTRESGLSETVKDAVFAQIRGGRVSVLSDALASPTGFPFKVLQMPGTLSDQSVYLARERTCEFGFLREAYTNSDGELGWRCAAEPVQHYVGKGGDISATVGRKCLCAGLAAAAGLASLDRAGREEPLIITTGRQLDCIALLLDGRDSYSAADVVSMVTATAP